MWNSSGEMNIGEAINWMIANPEKHLVTLKGERFYFHVYNPELKPPQGSFNKITANGPHIVGFSDETDKTFYIPSNLVSHTLIEVPYENDYNNDIVVTVPKEYLNKPCKITIDPL